MKTNKSYLKRVKVSKNGVLRTRSAGQNHCNAKESRAARGSKSRGATLHMTNKARSRFLVNF